MAVVMSMHWPEATLDQYEQTRKDVKWETKVPTGAQFHVAWMAADGFRVVDLWDSAEDFQRFVETRLNPAVARVGIQGQPQVVMAPAHAIFAPNVPRPRAPKRSSTRPKARAKHTAKRIAKKARTSPKRKGKKGGKR
jgi:hypothetical protein